MKTIVGTILVCLFLAPTVYCDEITYGDWTVEIPPLRHEAVLRERGIEVAFKMEATFDRYGTFTLVCSRQGDFDWSMQMTVMSPGVSEIVFPDGTSFQINNKTPHSKDIPAIIRKMISETSVSVTWRGTFNAPRETSKVSLRGVSAALRAHLDRCPAEGVEAIRAAL